MNRKQALDLLITGWFLASIAFAILGEWGIFWICTAAWIIGTVVYMWEAEQARKRAYKPDTLMSALKRERDRFLYADTIEDPKQQIKSDWAYNGKTGKVERVAPGSVSDITYGRTLERTLWDVYGEGKK